MATLPPNTPQDVQEFYAYWLSLPKVDLLPDLGDFFDHVPPHLQPFVGIVDVTSPSESRVRLYSAGLAEVSGEDPTGEPVIKLFTDELQAIVAPILREAAGRPVGYLCIRDTRAHSGLTIQSPSICLPIRSKNLSAKTLINYSHMPKPDVTMTPADQPRLVSGWRLVQWIDVGAGVPD